MKSAALVAAGFFLAPSLFLAWLYFGARLERVALRWWVRVRPPRRERPGWTRRRCGW